MSGTRQGSGGGVLVFLLAIAALVIVLGKAKPENGETRLGSLQLNVRTWAERLWDSVRPQAERRAIRDNLTFCKLQQREYLFTCERTRELLATIRAERRAWAKLQRESDRRMRALERCPALLKAANGFLQGGESWTEAQTADLDYAAFTIETLTAPTRVSFEDPNGDYVPGEDVQSHLLKVQAWLDGIVSEFRTRRLGLTNVFRKLDSGSGCFEDESE